MGTDTLHVISRSEFELESSNVTSSQVQYCSNGEYWVNTDPGVPGCVLISEKC